MKLPIYIGKWPDCGCVTAACVDDPDHKKDTAKFISDLIKDGRIVERLSADQFEKTVKLCRCPHRDRSKRRFKQEGNPQVVQQLLKNAVL